MSAEMYEQETIINFLRVEDSASIYTSDLTMMTKLDRLCENFPDVYKLETVDRLQDGSIASKTYAVSSKKMISFRGKKKHRNITEEQRLAAVERAKKMQEAKRKKREQSNLS